MIGVATFKGAIDEEERVIGIREAHRGEGKIKIGEGIDSLEFLKGFFTTMEAPRSYVSIRRKPCINRMKTISKIRVEFITYARYLCLFKGFVIVQ